MERATPPLLGNDLVIPWGSSIHMYPTGCSFEIPSLGIKVPLHLHTSGQLLVNLADYDESMELCGAKRTREDAEDEEESTRAEGEQEQDPAKEEDSEPRAKRSRSTNPKNRRPRGPRKRPEQSFIPRSPALQSELKKHQHAAARGASASSSERSRVDWAAEKALALLRPAGAHGTFIVAQQMDDGETRRRGDRGHSRGQRRHLRDGGLQRGGRGVRDAGRSRSTRDYHDRPRSTSSRSTSSWSSSGGLYLNSEQRRARSSSSDAAIRGSSSAGRRGDDAAQQWQFSGSTASESSRRRPANDGWPAKLDKDAIVAEATNAVLADVAADLAHTTGLPLESVSPAGLPVVLGQWRRHVSRSDGQRVHALPRAQGQGQGQVPTARTGRPEVDAQGARRHEVDDLEQRRLDRRSNTTTAPELLRTPDRRPVGGRQGAISTSTASPDERHRVVRRRVSDRVIVELPPYGDNEANGEVSSADDMPERGHAQRTTHRSTTT